MKTVGLVVLKGGLLNSQCYASFTWRSSEQKLADKQHFPSESVANYGDHLKLGWENDIAVFPLQASSSSATSKQCIILIFISL